MNKSAQNQRGKQIAWRGLSTAIASGLLAITLAPTTLAQSEQDEAQEAGLLEEVIVTAQRREQVMQEVPMSISAFGGEQLAANAGRQPGFDPGRRSQPEPGPGPRLEFQRQRIYSWRGSTRCPADLSTRRSVFTWMMFTCHVSRGDCSSCTTLNGSKYCVARRERCTARTPRVARSA